jgi:hypothetical protein
MLNANEQRVLEYIKNKAGIAVTEADKANIMFCDFDLNDPDTGIG